jgi:hypothetical protein
VSRRTAIFPAVIGAMALLLLPKLWLADADLYRQTLTPQRLLVLAAICKLGLLVAAAAMAWRVARWFAGSGPAAAGWRWVAAGFAASSGGQAILAWYQVVLQTSSPYPSAADPLFVLGMVLLVMALLRILLAYAGAELPLASGREVAGLAALAAVPLLALGFWLLRPVLAEPAAPMEQLLNVAYPVLDCVLLVPTFVLARLTARLRGGRVHQVWTVLLAGFLATAAGDVLFAYFSTLGMERLDPLVDLMYVASYGLWAWGAALQLQVVGASWQPPPVTS